MLSTNCRALGNISAMSAENAALVGDSEATAPGDAGVVTVKLLLACAPGDVTFDALAPAPCVAVLLWSISMAGGVTNFGGGAIVVKV